MHVIDMPRPNATSLDKIIYIVIIIKIKKINKKLEKIILNKRIIINQIIFSNEVELGLVMSSTCNDLTLFNIRYIFSINILIEKLINVYNLNIYYIFILIEYFQYILLL